MIQNRYGCADEQLRPRTVGMSSRLGKAFRLRPSFPELWRTRRRGQVFGVSDPTARARHSVATAACWSVLVLNDLLTPRATDERELIPPGAAGISRFRRGPHKR